MDTLKLTTLTMLIPLGWAVSVDAYPDHLEKTGRAGNLAPQVACGITSPSPRFQDVGKQKPDHFRSDLDALLGHHQLIQRPEPHDFPTDACRLDLDHIDIN